EVLNNLIDIFKVDKSILKSSERFLMINE
ncbi:MAG: hypothetical protein ACJAVG_001035, partial [Rickettsiales bacterium]